MLFIGLGLFDRWSRVVWRQFRAGSGDHDDAVEPRSSSSSSALVTVFFGFVRRDRRRRPAVDGAVHRRDEPLAGAHTVATGETRASRRIYTAAAGAGACATRGREIVLVQLEGAVFFGTAERLAREVEPLGPGAKFVILDLQAGDDDRRVGRDGARSTVAGSCTRRARRLLLAGIVRRRPARARAARASAPFSPRPSRAGSPTPTRRSSSPSGTCSKSAGRPGPAASSCPSTATAAVRQDLTARRGRGGARARSSGSTLACRRGAVPRRRAGRPRLRAGAGIGQHRRAAASTARRTGASRASLPA